jgi:hypothetical protein
MYDGVDIVLIFVLMLDTRHECEHDDRSHPPDIGGSSLYMLQPALWSSLVSARYAYGARIVTASVQHVTIFPVPCAEGLPALWYSPTS